MDDEPTMRVSIGCRHDIPEVAALARGRLPSMTNLHETSWGASYRFGAGLHPLDQFFPIVHAEHSDGREELAAFAWIDAAMDTDFGVQEPWWCINALAVAGPYARRGLGSELVQMIERQARTVGIVSLYGQSFATSAAFWSACGYSLTQLGGQIVSEERVPVPDQAPQRVVMSAEPHQHYFVKQVPESRGVPLRIAKLMR